MCFFVIIQTSDSAGSPPAATLGQDSPSDPSASSVPLGYDGLRYRGGLPQYDPQSPPPVPQWSANHSYRLTDAKLVLLSCETAYCDLLKHVITPALFYRPEAAQVPLQGGLPANMPPHPVYLPMQMLWWQQMYARQYYMQ